MVQSNKCSIGNDGGIVTNGTSRLDCEGLHKGIDILEHACYNTSCCEICHKNAAKKITERIIMYGACL